MNNDYYDKEYYEYYIEYTLADFFEIYKKPNPEDWNEFLNAGDGFLSTRTSKLEWLTYGGDLEIIYNSPIFKILERVIVSKYLDSIIANNEGLDFSQNNYEDYPYSVKEFNKVYGKFMRKFEGILTKTFPKYSMLIQNYYRDNKEFKEFLLPIVNKTNSKSRNNEIPTTSVSDPYDSKYANNSNIAEVESSFEGSTLINRLQEIHENCYNIYEEWCNEFAPLFRN